MKEVGGIAWLNLKGANLNRVIRESLFEKATYNLKPDLWNIARLAEIQGECS